MRSFIPDPEGENINTEAHEVLYDEAERRMNEAETRLAKCGQNCTGCGHAVNESLDYADWVLQKGIYAPDYAPKQIQNRKKKR